MKPRVFLIVFSLNCLALVSYAVNPACECVVYQSYGRSQGTFTSPNFPEVYPSGLNCILYTFIGDLDEIVELTFVEFDVKVPITNKCTDFLRFFLDLQRPEVNEATAWQYELCGNVSMIQKRHYSSGRALILEFHTDTVQANHTGFRGIFKFLDKEQFEIVGGFRRWGTQCTYDFNSNKTPKEGRFFSPRYPQNYPPGANCQYVFNGMEGERVKVTFQNIQLENIDGSCESSPDFIEVRDGPDSTTPAIARYCNTRNGEQIVSTGDSLYIEFIVDERKQRQGFAAMFEFIKEPKKVPQSNGPHPTQNTYPNPHGNTYSPGDSPGRAVPTVPTTKPTSSDSSPQVTDCDIVYRSSAARNGTFTSPQYPSPYPGSKTCRYRFIGAGRERVQVIFNKLDLNYPGGDPDDPADCEGIDSVTLSVLVDSISHNLGVYCGSKQPPMLMSNNNGMEVIFKAITGPTAATGFTATYGFVTDFGIKTGTQDPDMVCGFTFHSENEPNGTFTSPNFPGLYPRNTECHYLFYGQENDRIHITFPYFDVEGIPPGCIEDTQSDYVEFSNFHVNLKDRKMYRSCGTMSMNHPEPQMKTVNSDGNFFRVTFKSNDVYDATGFEGFYQFRKYIDPFKKPSPGSYIKGNASYGTRIRINTAVILLSFIVISLL